MTATAELLRDARAVADAVLLEGYVLYPYRASAAKNRYRWQFGVLFPPSWAQAHAEHAASRTECLVDPGHDDTLTVEARFLHVVRREVHALTPQGLAPVERLDSGDAVHVPWDEGSTEQVEVKVPLSVVLHGEQVLDVEVPGSRSTEDVVGGQLVREARPLVLRLRLSAVRLDGPYGVVRLRVDLENLADVPATASREEALPAALVAAHLVLGLSDGAFLSLAGPPEWARPAAATCVNEHTWPVVVGGTDRSPVVLSSPIILDDDPRLAPETSTVLYDATEIDEILTLRTLTLTDEERREARGTDPRAAEVVDQVDHLPPELLERLHGAIRSLRPVPAGALPEPEAAPPLQPWWDPDAVDPVDPEHDSVEVRGVPVSRGSRVVLRPGVRATDAQDLFLVDRSATVQAVVHDVDGGVHVAVTVDDDPLAEVQAAHGRYRYFRPDELEVRP